MSQWYREQKHVGLQSINASSLSSSIIMAGFRRWVAKGVVYPPTASQRAAVGILETRVVSAKCRGFNGQWKYSLQESESLLQVQRRSALDHQQDYSEDCVTDSLLIWWVYNWVDNSLVNFKKSQQLFSRRTSKRRSELYFPDYVSVNTVLVNSHKGV